MVKNMDSPSPQCVGQEFVRQYYTMLNEAPSYMHRFYSHNSSFVHGGIEKPGEELPPVMGQAAIHKKILSLNFSDCHARIRQVDSQGTVDRAVVVQVAGELSNKGQPMRRFMQTFVLAPQSPKKYYVYNDIFRYQDEVFHDCDTDEVENVDGVCYTASPVTMNDGVAVAHSTSTGHLEQEQALRDEMVNVEEYDAAQDGGDNAVLPQAVVSTVVHTTDQVSVVPPIVLTDQISSADQETQSYESGAVSPSVGAGATSGGIPPNSPAFVSSQGGLSGSQSIPVATVRSSPVPPGSPRSSMEPQEGLKSVSDGGSKPIVGTLSWAALASKNPASSPAGPVAGVVPPSKPQAMVKPELKPDTSGSTTTPGALSQRQQQSQRIERSSVERDQSSEYDDQSRRAMVSQNSTVTAGGGSLSTQVYPDEQQLFVGNLPHVVSNEELREFFSQFGQVIDVRINRKGPTRDVPNFGFITFDSPDVVQKVLAAKPLFLGNKHRLNVEEKKLPGDLSGGQRGGPPGGPRGGGGMDTQRGGFKGYAPGRGGGVVSFRGGRGTWRGRPRGAGSYGPSYRSNNEDMGQSGDTGEGGNYHSPSS